LTLRQKVTRWLFSVAFVVGSLGLLTWVLQREWLEQLIPATLAAGFDPEDSSQSRLGQAAEHAARPIVALTDDSLAGQPSGSGVSSGLPVSTFRLDSIQPDKMVQRFSGVVTARRSSRLAAKQLGRIMQVHVDLGDAVRGGQVLVELDQRELQAEREVLLAQLGSAHARLDELQSGPRTQEIEQAEALVRQMKATLELRRANSNRTNALVKTASVSRQEHDESVTELEATEAQLVTAEKSLELLREGTREEQIRSQDSLVRGLQSQLDKIDVLISDLVITAPFDGHVQARMMDEGTIVSPGQPIVEVVETGQLEVHVGLPSQLVNSGALSGARVRCGSQLLPAELARVAPSIDQRTRNLEAVFSVRPVSCVIPASGSNSIQQDCQVECRIGQAIEVELDVSADRGGWWLPSTALIPANRGLWSVLVVKQSAASQAAVPPASDDLQAPTGEAIAQPVQVELLRSSGDWSQVQGAFRGDEWLVLNGLHRITPGQRVIGVPVRVDEVVPTSKGEVVSE